MSRDLPLGVLVLIMAAVLAPLLVLSQVTAHWRTDVVDDQMFGYYGWRILHGATVYLDVWDNKPPGIYWINALGFLIGNDSYAGVIALCAAAIVGSLVCFFVIADSAYSRGAAALATVLAGFYLTHGYFQCGTNRTETFLIVCELAAVALYVRGYARPRWWQFLIAGMLCGAAFTFKQVGLAAWGAMGLHTIMLVFVRALPWKAGLARCLLLLAGVVVTLTAVTAVLVGQGALDAALYATFTFNRAYMGIGRSEITGNYANWFLLKEHIWPVLTLPVLMAVAAVVHALLWWLRPWFNPLEIKEQIDAKPPACPRTMFLFVVWFMAAYYGAILSPHAFRHYIVPSIPPMMLMAAYLINVLRAEQRILRRFQQRAWVLAAFVAMVYFAGDAVTRHFEVLSGVYVDRIVRGEKAEWELVGAEVARLTNPDDPIQCWAYLPGAYLVAKRPNACRFTTTEKIGQVKTEMEADFISRELHETLYARPPVVFVVNVGDYNWLRGELPNHPEPPDPLAAWLDENYTKVSEVTKGNYFIFMRNDRAAELAARSSAVPP